MSADPQAPAGEAAPTDIRPGDAVPASWVDVMPAAVRPYLRLMRLDRPIGVWLLFWPCVFGLALGAGAEGRAMPNLLYVLLTGIGSIVMRGAGCTYNDIVDRDFDARVARTRGRPIPSGAVGVRTAWAFAIALSLTGFAVLVSFNRFAILVGVTSLFFIACYPFMKRITFWPQAVLGLAFAYGGLMGWAAAMGSLAWPAVLIYASAIAWTIAYDTIYALQDVRDDIAIGVKSTARLFGKNVQLAVGVLYASSSIFAAIAAFLSGAGLWTLVGIGGFSLHLIWQTNQISEKISTEKALFLFRSNRDAGLLMCSGFLAQSIINGL